MKNRQSNLTGTLQVGCSFSVDFSEIKDRYSEVNFAGVEICKEFADHCQAYIGACINVPAHNYIFNKNFFLIVTVTMLMYLKVFEREMLVNIVYRNE